MEFPERNTYGLLVTRASERDAVVGNLWVEQAQVWLEAIFLFTDVSWRRGKSYGGWTNDVEVQHAQMPSACVSSGL